MRVLYIFVISVLISGLTAGQTTDQPAGTIQQPIKKQPTRQTPRVAPDGDGYTKPTSVQPRPRPHLGETNPGRPPAQIRGGSDAPWIAGAVGAGGALVLQKWLSARNRPAAKLSREGPKMPDEFSMSGLSIGAFVRADWPVVLDYYLPNGGALLVTVQSAALPAFNYRLRGDGRRRQVIFRLPRYFPQKPTAGSYAIRVMRSAGGATPGAYLRLFGVGAGERAVGSVAIDQVTFAPGTIRPKNKEVANYGFHAHTLFDRVRAEFLKVVLAQGQLVSQLDDHHDINGVQPETASTYQWNGRGKKISPGEHMLQVRAWESALNKANWVIAWSADQVMVEE